MFPSFRMGTLFGFPIRLNLSFLLLLGAVFLWMGGLPGLIVALVAFGSVLLHELGHALMARRLGVPVADIELHFFGGAARIVGLPRTPGHEIAIAAAGPAVSFALAGLGHGLGAISGVHALALFGWVNLALGAFNLVPAFPSDGGRILRAILARRRGLVDATDLAVKVGRVICVTLIGVGLWTGAYQLVVVSVVLWLMGSAERLAVRFRGNAYGWRVPAEAAEADGAAGRRGDAAAAPATEYIPPGEVARRPARISSDGRPVILVWRN
jgi:Zn-dependent protease